MSNYCDGTADIYNERRVRARAAHKCSACAERIEPRHLYWRIAIIYDHTATTIKRCERCQAIHKHLRSLMINDGLWPDEELKCGHGYEEQHGPTPPWVQELAFITQREMQEKIGNGQL